MLNHLRIFVKVVEKGSFSKAATVLNMAPSSVARSVNTLEKELNISLFERSTRYLRLTDKGDIFYEGAQKIIQDTDQLKASLSNENVEIEGKLKISVFESFGRLHICPLLANFLKQYPKIEIDIELDNRMVDLFTEDIDIAIRIGKPKDSQLKARKLLPNHTLLCAAPSYIKQYGVPSEPEDLQSHNCLILNTGRQRSYWFFKKNKHKRKILVNGNLRSSGGEPILSACQNGMGIIQISDWMVSDPIQRGDLVVLLSEWQSSLSEEGSGDIYAVYKPRSYPNPLVRVFIDYLVENITHKKAES